MTTPTLPQRIEQHLQRRQQSGDGLPIYRVVRGDWIAKSELTDDSTMADASPCDDADVVKVHDCSRGLNAVLRRAEAAELLLRELVAEHEQVKRALKLKVGQWRNLAVYADRLAFEYDQKHDGASSHAFRKERRIWTTCADELEALLTVPSSYQETEG